MRKSGVLPASGRVAKVLGFPGGCEMLDHVVPYRFLPIADQRESVSVEGTVSTSPVTELVLSIS